MGQKVNPNGFRVGVIRDWNTRWYASKKDFSDYLVEDRKIRDHLKKVHYAAGVAKIDIERAANKVTVSIHTARPGKLIGKGGKINAWMPSSAAYGAEGDKELGVAPNATLYFEIELVDLDKYTTRSRRR